MNSTIAKLISGYELSDLQRLISELEDRVTQKKSEAKVLVWRVVDRRMCYGNFPDADYLKAIDRLKETAIERWTQQSGEKRVNRSGVTDLELHIQAEFFPESDAQEYLKND